MTTKGTIKIIIKRFIKDHHHSGVFLEVHRLNGVTIESVDVDLGLGRGINIGIPTDIYDEAGDEVDKEVFVEELKAIIDAHNEKYKNE